MVKYRPLVLLFCACTAQLARSVGARPMAGQLTLDQSIGVRLLCPQPKQDPRQSEGLLFKLSEPRMTQTALMTLIVICEVHKSVLICGFTEKRVA
jgi:hypothetical protein